MNKKELFETLNIKPRSIRNIGSASIISTEDRKYVIKKINRKVDPFDYLQTRDFNSFPKVYNSVDDSYELTDYIEEKQVPIEQKLEDLAYLVSILHLKTSFNKTVDEDYIKGIYENLVEKQNKLIEYYSDLQDMIEMEVYMSPSNYLLIRNISMIYFSLHKSRDYIEEWYNILKQEPKIRYAYIHGNLEVNHIIEGDNLYLISWDKSRIDLPIYDLEILYRNSFLDISIGELLDVYGEKYPLKKEELYLLISLLLIPEKLNLDQDEYSKTKQVTNIVLYTNKTLSYLKNNTNKTNDNTNHQ